MKAKLIILILIVLSVAGGGYFYYQNVLRFTDDFTDCPVKAFRNSATNPDAALNFVTESSMGSLATTERCSLDCTNGNYMACVLYGAAQQKGVFLMQDIKQADQTLQKACDRGEVLACDLQKRAAEKAAAQAKEEARLAAKEKYKDLLNDISKSKSETGKIIAAALAYFNGSKNPMMKSGLLKWYNSTVNYLLFEGPNLSVMHQIPGAKIEKGGLEEFVQAKYMSGKQKPDYKLINEFFQKFMRLGVQQIKLDYHVEKKKENDLPKHHGFFRAKHTFLYHAGQSRLVILDALEKDVNYEIENQ